MCTDYEVGDARFNLFHILSLLASFNESREDRDIDIEVRKTLTR